MVGFLRNIRDFTEGNLKYYFNKVDGLPAHIVEQVNYRYSLCKDSCLVDNECEVCGCNATKKAFVKESCNGGNKFPDLMGLDEWNKFKEDNLIEDD